MRSLTLVLALLAGLLVACGDDGGTPIDARPDSAVVDAGIDGAVIDGAVIDGAVIDGAAIDGAVIDGAAIDATAIDAGSLDASTVGQIQAARDTADGTGLTLPIEGATITYLKPALGTPANDPAGFTIQAAQSGPALFVAVVPSMVNPPAAVGDVVSFTITDLTTVGSQRRVAALTGYTRLATGANVGALAQNLTAATDVVTALDSYDSELIDVTGTVAAAFASAGTGFEAAQITTTGIPVIDANFRVRVVATLRDALDLVVGCRVVLDNTPVGRFNAQAQLAAFVAADLTVSNCPAPTVVSAIALSPTSARVTFDRNVLAASVVAAGSQFTVNNGLTVSAATVSGRTVTLTTSAQTGGTSYAVTVATTVTDLQGTALGTPATATFIGFQTPAVVRINEFNANITTPGTCDLIELRVVSGGSMNGYFLRERDTGTLITFNGLSVATNDLIVVHMGAAATCNTGNGTQETTAPNQQPAATFAGNYDTAYDWWSTDTGLTFTDNVFTLYNGANEIVDAVFASDDRLAATAALGTENQAALVGVANQWSPMMTTYIDTVFRLNSVEDLNLTGTTAAGTSIQRLDNTDDNNVADWNTATVLVQPHTFGLINVGQTAF